MTKSLHLTGDKYNIAVLVFTVAYITFGVPANIIVKKAGTRSLSLMMFIWGLFAMGQGFTKTWAGLVACRFMMGKCGRQRSIIMGVARLNVRVRCL